MESTVSFRDFEERDIDFIYKCKNDEKLNSMIVGDWHPFTYEEAVKWVHGCMGEHDTYKFWAVCTNDEERRIVGWVSMSNIDKKEKTARFHGIVIADPLYRDGLAEIECYLFIYKKAFLEFGLEKVIGSSITKNGDSQIMKKAFYCTTDNISENSINRDGVWYNVSTGHLSKEAFISHYKNGDYEIMPLIKRIKKLKKMYV